MKSIMLKIASGVIATLLSVAGALTLIILLQMQADIKQIQTTLNSVCDTQATYWMGHKCKRG